MPNFPTSKPSASPLDHTVVLDEVRAMADGIGYASVTKTTTYTAVAGDFVKADTSAGGWTLTLPTAAAGLRVRVIKSSSDTNTLTIAGTINGDSAGATIIEQYAGALLVSDGTAWFLAGPF